MNDLLFLIGGIAIGTYFAESIRETVPVLKPSVTEDESGAA